MEVKDILKSSELFGGFTAEYLEKIAALCRRQRYGKGEIIFNEGSEAKELYILADGHLALEKKVKQASASQSWETVLEEIGKGEAFGWSAIVEPHTFEATVRCLTDCEVLVLDSQKLRAFMDDEPRLGYEMTKRLAHLISNRLANARVNLTKMLGQVQLSQEIT